ncbi:MAG: solute-binding protein [Planctomycetes bacterium]|nr:solute-binding protein [Planctomycetota bacterium]
MTLQSSCLLVLALLAGCGDRLGKSKVLRLATTTSTRDSGLLDLLIPTFEQQQDVRVDVIAAGTGKALKLGEAGDVDVVLVHARQAEETFMAAGFGCRREEVMVNQFELLGPADDPAKIRGMLTPEALQRIARGGFRMVSRGDDSGTHKRELELWAQARPDWDQYVETGQGMGPSLIIADQMFAYVLSDRGTYLRFRPKIDLVPLTAQSPDMKNPYGIMVVHIEEQPAAQTELAQAMVDYFISPQVQTMIQNFRLEGEPLFFPLQPTLLQPTIEE